MLLSSRSWLTQSICSKVFIFNSCFKKNQKPKKKKKKNTMRVSQKFSNILIVSASLSCLYHMTEEVQFRWKIPVVIGSIAVVGALTCCALFHFVYDFKAVRMNLQSSLIRECICYKFNLGHNATETSKNICFAKSVWGGGGVDHTT